MGRGWIASIFAGAIAVHISCAQAQVSAPATKDGGTKKWSCATPTDNPDGLVTFVRDKGPLSAQLQTASADGKASGAIPVVRGGQPELFVVSNIPNATARRYYAAAHTGLPGGEDTSKEIPGATSIDILGAKTSGTDPDQVTTLTVRMPDWDQLSQLPMRRPTTTVYVAACPTGSEGADVVAVASAQVSSWWWSWILALGVVLLLYALLAWAFSEPPAADSAQARQPAGETRAQRFGRRFKEKARSMNPLELSAGITGRSSLGNLQVLFFTLVTTWLFVYTVYRTGTWAKLELALVAPFLIVSAGAITARWMRASDQVSVVNLGWLRDRGWIRSRASLRDLFMSRGEPDPTRFQAVALSVVIGLALVIAFLNDRPEMGDATTILALLGASQATYVFGKFVKPDQPDSGTLERINDVLDEARAKEAAFCALVEAMPREEAWKANLPTKLLELSEPMANAKEKTSAVMAALGPLATTAQAAGNTPLGAMSAAHSCCEPRYVKSPERSRRSAARELERRSANSSCAASKTRSGTQEAPMTKLLSDLQALNLSGGQPEEAETAAYQKAVGEWQETKAQLIPVLDELASTPIYEAVKSALAADTGLERLNDQVKSALTEYGNAAASAASLVAEELDADLPSKGYYELPLKRCLNAVASLESAVSLNIPMTDNGSPTGCRAESWNVWRSNKASMS